MGASTSSRNLQTNSGQELDTVQEKQIEVTPVNPNNDSPVIVDQPTVGNDPTPVKQKFEINAQPKVEIAKDDFADKMNNKIESRDQMKDGENRNITETTLDKVEIIGPLEDFHEKASQNELNTNVGMFQKSNQNFNSKNFNMQHKGSESSEVENIENPENLEVIETPRKSDFVKSDVNVLLIGLVGSGKSTLKKHMQLSLGKGYSIEDRKEYRRLIRRYILQQSLELVLENWSYLNSLESDDRKPFTQFMQYCINKEIKIRPYIPLCNHTQDALKSLWAEKRFQDMYESNPVWRHTSLDLFCARCSEIGNDGYLPTDTDIIRYFGCLEKHKTLYLELTKPKVSTIEISEFRQPKLAQLKTCNVAMFFVDICQIDTEHHKCSLKAALKSFNSVINQQELENKPVFILFTKRDVLEDKLKHMDIRSAFPELKKSVNCDEVCEHILNMFQERCEDRKIHHYFVNAFDFGSCHQILNEIFEIAHSKYLK